MVNAYLCPAGPTGAESYKQSLYFYDVATERSSIEWARQAAHELGHLLLPPIGRFASPESFASGFLGERLLLQYLALEAGLIAGVCRACAKQFGVDERVEAIGLPLISDMMGHAGMAAYAADGYGVISM